MKKPKKLKEKFEKWTCKCGIKRKIRGKIKSCPYCNEFPKKEEIKTAKKSRILRHL